MKFGEPPPVEMLRWSLAERFGWTLKEVDSLPLSDLFEFIQIEDGRARAKKRD